MTTWSKRTKRLAIGTAAAATICGALMAWHYPAAPAPAGGPAGAAQQSAQAATAARFVPGARRAYSLDLDQRVRLESTAAADRAAGGAHTYDFSVRGRLVFTVLGGAEGVIWVEGALQEPSSTLRANGAEGHDTQERAAFEGALARPFYVELSPTGAARAVHFQEGVDPVARGLLKTALALTQVVGRAADLRGAASWEAEESDPTGDYVASYGRASASGTLEKSRARFVRVATANGLTPAENAGKITSTLKTFITLDPALWPASIDGADHLHIEPGEGMPSIDASASIRLALRETSSDRARAAGFTGAPAGYERTTLANVSGPVDAAKRDRELLAGATLASLRAELDQVARNEDKGEARAHLHDKLAALFRLDPAAAREAAAGALAGEDPATARVVIGALGTAGTPDAQGALAELAQSETLDPKLRTNAIANLGLVESPTASTLEALEEQSDSETRSVRSTATLALGNAARTLEANGDTEDATVPGLLERLASATTPADQALCLRALGNAGDARALPAIEAALSSPEERVRGAAAEALRFIADPRADALLSKVLAEDPSPTVRRSAVLAATFRDIGPLLPALGAALTRDGDERVRMDIVAALGVARRTIPAALALLRGAAEHDPSADIRKRAAGYLAS